MTLFQRVVVLSHRGQGVMGLARAWANRLNVPLQAVSVGQDSDPGQARQYWNPDAQQGLQPTDLVICGQDVPSVQKKLLLREIHRHGGPALLFTNGNRHQTSEASETSQALAVSPGSFASALPSRILLIDQGSAFSDPLLEISVQLCDIFRAGLVVLTVARTEHSARERQRRAREIIDASLPPHPALSPQRRGGHDGAVRVNFDFLAGAEVRSAAASVARWRHCQLVVLEANAAWGRRLGFHSGSWITERLESLSFLVIPEDLGSVLSRPGNADSSFSARSRPRTLNDESAECATANNPKSEVVHDKYA